MLADETWADDGDWFVAAVVFLLRSVIYAFGAQGSSRSVTMDSIRVENVVASSDLGQELDFETLAQDLPRVEYEPAVLLKPSTANRFWDGSAKYR